MFDELKGNVTSFNVSNWYLNLDVKDLKASDLSEVSKTSFKDFSLEDVYTILWRFRLACTFTNIKTGYYKKFYGREFVYVEHFFGLFASAYNKNLLSYIPGFDEFFKSNTNIPDLLEKEGPFSRVFGTEEIVWRFLFNQEYRTANELFDESIDSYVYLYSYYQKYVEDNYSLEDLQKDIFLGITLLYRIALECGVFWKGGEYSFEGVTNYQFYKDLLGRINDYMILIESSDNYLSKEDSNYLSKDDNYYKVFRAFFMAEDAFKAFYIIRRYLMYDTPGKEGYDSNILEYLHNYKKAESSVDILNYFVTSVFANSLFVDFEYEDSKDYSKRVFISQSEFNFNLHILKKCFSMLQEAKLGEKLYHAIRKRLSDLSTL